MDSSCIWNIFGVGSRSLLFPHNIQTLVIDGERRTKTACNTTSRTETDGCSIHNTSGALLKPGQTLEQVKFRETTTTEKFYACIKFDFGMLAI